MHRTTSAVAEAPLSTTEALRRALAALGSDAQVNDIIDYAREHFGLDAQPGPATPAEPPALASPAPAADPGRKPQQPQPPRRGKGRGAPES
jgi:hypothetical protein